MSESLPPIELIAKSMGRMISPSKSSYRSSATDPAKVFFNAGLWTKTKGHVWHGDLDLTIDEPRIKEIAGELGETIYVFAERDCHFATGTDVEWEKAVSVISP